MPKHMTQKSSFITRSELTFQDHLDHFLARMGINRMQHRVVPGLYTLGKPDQTSPVFVTGNYTLSFDAVRSALKGIDAYLLVLDTKGINVWCAAGKGTFGTTELVNRIKDTGLENVVSHRKLVLPQLGATGVSAYQTKELCGFEVEYGPVRAEDLPEYLLNHIATPEMRQVRFNLSDRMILIPVELVSTFLPMLAAFVALFFLGGWFLGLWLIAAWLAAFVLFLILLPWIPTREFSTKGFILGFFISIPFIFFQFSQIGHTIIQRILDIIPMLLAMTSLTAFLTLNLTGSTPITCWTSVRREIFRYVPIMAAMLAGGIILFILKLFGLGK
jgi:hypothetical protein